MVGALSAGSEEELVTALLQRAEELWGAERAAVIRPRVIQTAQHLWQLSRNAPPMEDGAAFPM